MSAVEHATRLTGRAGSAVLAALALLASLPAVALAHPLGNFTINHYAAIRVTPEAILLDVVVDQAEIPTFQARLALDNDGDGAVSAQETEAGREPACRALLPDLVLAVDGRAVTPSLVAAGLHFPPGAGGLATMRLVCELSVPLEGGLGDGREIVFEDRSFAGRLGWREIVAEGDGTTVHAGETALAVSVSHRLATYPDDRLQTPLAMTKARLRVTSGGPSAAPWRVPDASPLRATGVPSGAAPQVAAQAVAVPGGIGGDLPAIFRSPDVSPAVLLLAFGTALALGAGHALTPGHGKSLMAAYLVGTRGTAVHAVGLGLSVTVSHTLGILVLAALVVLAQGSVAPDVVVRWTPLAAAVTIVLIGGWMLVAELRRQRRADRHGQPHDHDGGLQDEHSQGGPEHTHAPTGTTITWRSLFALGLAGGIIPSTSALLILLGAIAAGRPGFGVLLLVAFGVGMALVLSGLGLLLVRGRGLFGRLLAGSPLVQRVSPWAPVAAAVIVLSVGVWLTAQALVGSPAL